MLARKGVLASSPDAKNMTKTEWIMEYLALKKDDKEKYETNVKTAKSLLIYLLGLNILRPEDDQGYPKDFETMTDIEKESFIPLTMWCGHSGILKRVSEQQDKANAIANASNDQEYEKLVAAIDAADGDMEPILADMGVSTIDPAIYIKKAADTAYTRQLAELVKPIESAKKEPVSVKVTVGGKI